MYRNIARYKKQIKVRQATYGRQIDRTDERATDTIKKTKK